MSFGKKQRLKHDEFVPFAPTEPGTVNVFHCKAGRNNDRLYITRCYDDPYRIVAYCHHCGCSGVFSEKLSRYKKAASHPTRAGAARTKGHGVSGSDRQPDHSRHPSNPRQSHNGLEGGGHAKGAASFTSQDRSRKRGLVRKEALDSRRAKATQDWADLSGPATRFFLEGQVTEKDIKAHAITYRRDHDEVQLPVFEDGELVALQSRSFDPHWTGPKYVLKYTDKYKGGALLKQGSSTLVIVEDMLSAIRYHRLGVDVLCLLGSSITDERLVTILGYKRYIVHLDNDNRQIKMKQNKLHNTLNFFHETTVIKGACDPKHMTDAQLQEILDECNPAKSTGDPPEL